MLQNFVPARANLSTGVTIASPVLERNKWSYANPSATNEIEIMDGNLEGPIITTEYTDIYQGLTGSRAAYYTGEFSGSVIEYGDDWIERNFNPYLHPTASLTSSINAFNHSEFNILLNNVSESRLSNTRQDIEFIYGTTGSILAPAYLQDTNESLTTYNRARYEGAKVSSLLYSVYTSASADYSGDSSYGKTAAINKDTRQIGLFTEIVSSSLLPGRNRVSLKYLVDEFGGLTELNQRNKNWEDIQRTFIAGNYLNVSQFDNQKSSNQKSTDGNKLIFDSGYSYNPILYFAGCNLDSKIYFENQKELNSYLVTANNGNGNRSISGSGIPGIPVEASTGRIYNIFNNEIDPNNIFNPGTISTFPTYSVVESGDYKVEATFDLTVNMPLGGSSTWVFRLLKNGVAQVTDEQSINIVSSATASAQASIVYSQTYTSITSTAITTDKPVLISGTNYPAGSTLYKYNYTLLTASSYPPESDCNFSGFGPWYSIFGPNTINASGQACTGTYNVFDTIGTFYLIPDIDASPLEQTKTFSINRSIFNPITNTSQGDKLTLEFSQSYLSTNNYTASLSLGSLNISSLAVATGYASAACPYFSSSSLSASRAANDRQTITFSPGLSNFSSNVYQFIPNPLTGSQNTLYPIYGDVDYPFNINKFDKIITYLSDNSYIESNIISSSFSGSLFRIHTDIQLSDLYINNLMSGSYQRFLILSRQQDETSTYLTFKKREGSTSYGFIIPQNIAADVLANIDTITKEVQQKLLSDQSQVTINTF
jgi:cold shock CspA family protein